jgi:hypothetical protein
MQKSLVAKNIIEIRKQSGTTFMEQQILQVQFAIRVKVNNKFTRKIRTK